MLDSLREELTPLIAGGLRAVYVIGSVADGTAVPGSDLDLVVLLRTEADATVRAELENRLKRWSAAGGIDLDLELVSETETRKLANPSFKEGSWLLVGDDLRASIPLMSLDEWARDRLHTSYWRAVKFFHRPRPVVLPLTYPAPEDPLRGYILEGKTRQLLRHITWAATALIAYQGRRYVARKADVPRLYRESVGDGFSDYLETLYTRCKLDWHYGVPHGAEDREQLRQLIEQTLVFEQQFMAVYVEFLRRELTATDTPPAATLQALWVLTQLPLVVMQPTLEHLVQHSPTDEFRQRADEALHQLPRA